MWHIGGLGFWLVGPLLGGTLFNFSNFDWKVCHGIGSTHSPGFGFTIAYWQSRLEIVHPVCFLSYEEKGGWLVNGSQRGFVISVSCIGLFLFYSSLGLFEERKSRRRWSRVRYRIATNKSSILVLRRYLLILWYLDVGKSLCRYAF